MKRFVPFTLAAIVAATLVACKDNPTAPGISKTISAVANVRANCDPSVDPNCDPIPACDPNFDPGCDPGVPRVLVPADLTVEATQEGGAMVTLPDAIAVDNAGNQVPTTCTASGTVFLPLGTTMIGCSAVSANGSVGSATYTVTVVDTSAPFLQALPSRVVSATSPAGAVVNFSPSAFDVAAGAIEPSCTPASGSLFPVGTTTVVCTATDPSGNSSSMTFQINVKPPVINPVDALVASLNATISQLNLPAGVKAKLTVYVSQLPTTLANLSEAQKLDAIRKMQGLIAVVNSLTPRVIPAAQANTIISLANQVIAALSAG